VGTTNYFLVGRTVERPVQVKKGLCYLFLPVGKTKNKTKQQKNNNKKQKNVMSLS